MKKTEALLPVNNINVSNNINMNLNQNDLVEMAIEERVSQLALEIKSIEQQMKTSQKDCDDALTNLKESILDKQMNKMKEYNKVFTLASGLGLEIKESLVISLNNYSSERVEIGNYESFDLDTVQEYKDPSSYAKRHSYKTSLFVNIANDLSVNLVASTGNLSLTYNNKLSITQKQYSDVVTPFLKEQIKLGTILHDLKTEYLYYRYGDKRIKAQITKAALRKTDEGINILSMLEKATNVKLL